MSFDKIVDQKPAVKILREELQSERINHAYLFTGKEGVGKKTLAFEFVKALLCLKKETDGCNSCINCKKIDHFNHPDVKLLEKEEGSKQIKIDQIRELQKEISYKPYETDWKIYIIDGADNMTLPAANSLLKILEEPPSYAVIILLAEKINQLLPTVISRCQQVKLSNISQEKIREYLSQEKEQNIESKQIRLYSMLAQGSLGRAQELINNDDFFDKREEILKVLSRLPDLSTVNIFDYSDKLADYINDEFPFFNLISSWYRDIMLYMNEEQDNILNLDYIEEIKKQSQRFNIEKLIAIIKLIDKYQNYINSNVRKKLTLQVLMIKIRSQRV